MATVADYLARARHYLGVPYVFGGESPSGLDCSGLVQLCAHDLGLMCPRTSEEQYAQLPLALGAVQPGDLVFFDVPSDNQPQPAHVGIVTIPHQQMIDAPHTGVDVRYDPIFSGVMGYRRFPFTAPPPSPPFPIKEDDMKYGICSPGAGQPTWLIAGMTKLQIATPTDIIAWRALGAVDVTMTAQQLALIPTVAH